MSDQTLDDLLNDEVETEAEIEEVEEEAVKETPEPEAESEEAEETESTDEEGTPSVPEEKKEELTDKEKAFLAKANDEKAKRQELERKLAEKDKPEEVKAPDPIEDPEGYAAYVKNQTASIQSAMRIELSQEMMRQSHADYDEKEAAFLELAESNPALISQLQQSTNPAKFAYDTVVKHERMSQFDNFDDAVKSEVEKQLAAAKEAIRNEVEQEYSARLKKANSLPPSGAKQSLGSDDTIAGEESLADILGN